MENYAFSPWKEGRTQEEKQYLLQAEELEIKDGVEAIGNYTFYGCRNLKSLKFTDSLKQIGGGSFTGCSALRKLYVKMSKNMPSCIKDVVAETFHEVYVTIEFRETGEFAKLIFPEYYEEGVENTPARILENHVHGSGIRYRNSFLHKKLNILEYDKLFPYAEAWEEEEIVLKLALDRILYPMDLTETAEKKYIDYLHEHGEHAVGVLGKNKEYEAMQSILDKITPDREQTEKMLERAQRSGDSRWVSILMDTLQKHGRKKRKAFEL